MKLLHGSDMISIRILKSIDCKYFHLYFRFVNLVEYPISELFVEK